MDSTNALDKCKIINKIIAALYLPAEKAQQQELLTFILRNSRIHGNNMLAMSFRGEFYKIGANRHFPSNILHRSLRNEFREFLATKDSLEGEQKIIRSFLGAIMSLGANRENFERILPQTLHHALTGFHELPKSIFVLNEEQLQDFMSRNQNSIELIRRRMTYNMLGVVNQ